MAKWQRVWVIQAAAVLVLAMVLAAPAWADIDVITLKYRSAEQMLPLLTPLLEKGGAVTGTQNQIVIRSSARNIAELRKVVDSVDRQPRRLLISVRQSAEAAGSVQGGRISGSVYSSSGGNSAGSVRAQVYDSRNSQADGVTQTVQALEGAPAQIQVGESVAVPQTTVIGDIRRPGVAGAVVNGPPVFRDATTGFQVVARMAGDRVTLEISPRRDTLSGDNGAMAIQRAATTVSGRLGDWIDLGGISSGEARSGSISSQRSESRRIQVKVEELQ